jgi:hypothetical protein
VIAQWSALAAHEAAFLEPPAAPAMGSLSLPVAINDHRRLPPGVCPSRLPRDRIGHAAQADFLFVPWKSSYRQPGPRPAPIGQCCA